MEGGHVVRKMAEAMWEKLSSLLVELSEARYQERRSLITGRIPGRTDNEIKNYWIAILSKRVQVEDKIHEQDINDLLRSDVLNLDSHQNKTINAYDNFDLSISGHETIFEDSMDKDKPENWRDINTLATFLNSEDEWISSK
ncbi:transcription factor wer [Quercus suber]|uniref:Transcription factor wer n=1 Tax=Quercus suber TaxID=58331 RepID=A0AAW0J805_QUESU